MITSYITRPSTSSVEAKISSPNYSIHLYGEVHEDKAIVKASFPGFIDYVWECPIKDWEVYDYWNEVLYDKIDELRHLIVDHLQDNKPIFVDKLFEEVGFD